MNYIDLFHGIGGFALGAYWSGMKFENHFCSDIDSFCKKLYKLRFPDSIQLGDITKINTNKLKKKYGTKWIITGGFPCQDISLSGKGEGIYGKKSSLWFQYWKIIRSLRPKFAIVENVGMLVQRGLRQVLGSLAEIGYNAEWKDICASDVGASHKRERIWIVAYPNEFRNRSLNEKVFKLCQILQKQETRQISVPLTDQWYECGRNVDISGKVDGLSQKLDRWEGLGNAIVPQISQLIFEQIKEEINGI